MRSTIFGTGTLFVLAAALPVPLADAQTIEACVSPSGKLRIVGDAGSCKRKESPLSWGTQGPEGAQGATGATGATGAQGPAGPPGEGSGPPAVCTAVARVTIERLNGVGNDGVFDAHAFSFGLTYEPPFGGPGGGSGNLEYQSFNVTKAIDGTTKTLFEAATEGTNFPSATIELLDGGGEPVLTYTLGDIVIVSLQQGSPACGTVPSENLGFEFATVTPE